MADLLVDVGGSGSGSYVADTLYVDTPAGSSLTADQPWDTSGIMSPPPDDVLDTPRFDLTQFAMKFTGYTPGETKGFRVYTNWYSGTHYKYTITANGTLKATREYLAADSLLLKFDEFNAVADGSGNIRLVFDQVILFALISAIDVVDPFDIAGNPVITTASPLPAQVAGIDMDIEIEYSGGTGDSVISVNSGSSLPTGIGPDAVTIVGNHLVGTAYPGTYTFTLKATDEDDLTGTKAFSLTINPPKIPVVVEGNSQDAGTDSVSPGNYLQQYLGDAYEVFDVAAGGDGWTRGYLTEAATEVDVHVNPYASDSIAIGHGATNDFSSAGSNETPANVYSAMQTWCEGRTAAGFTRVIIATDYDRGDSEAALVNPKIDTLIASLLSNHSFCEKLLRYDSFAAFQNPSNTNIFNADKIHLINPGYAIMGQGMAGAILQNIDYSLDSTSNFGDDSIPVNNSAGFSNYEWYVKQSGSYALVSTDPVPDLSIYYQTHAADSIVNYVKLKAFNLAGEFEELESSVTVSPLSTTNILPGAFAPYDFVGKPGMVFLAKVRSRDNASTPNVTPFGEPVTVTIPTIDFNPIQISSLRGLYLPETLSASDGDHVVLQDSSGHGNHLVQATSGHQPIYKVNIQNSKPAVRFDGTDDFYSFPDFSAFTRARIYVVLIRANETLEGLWHFGTGSGGTYPDNSSQIYENFGTGGDRYHFYQTVSLRRAHLYSCSAVTGGDAKAYMNGILANINKNITFGINAASYIGKNNSPTYCHMDLLALAIFNDDLSQSQDYQMTKWANTNWALVL